MLGLLELVACCDIDSTAYVPKAPYALIHLHGDINPTKLLACIFDNWLMLPSSISVPLAATSAVSLLPKKLWS